VCLWPEHSRSVCPLSVFLIFFVMKVPLPPPPRPPACVRLHFEDHPMKPSPVSTSLTSGVRGSFATLPCWRHNKREDFQAHKVKGVCKRWMGLSPTLWPFRPPPQTGPSSKDRPRAGQTPWLQSRGVTAPPRPGHKEHAGYHQGLAVAYCQRVKAVRVPREHAHSPHGPRRTLSWRPSPPLHESAPSRTTQNTAHAQGFATATRGPVPHPRQRQRPPTHTQTKKKNPNKA
jgi:hypothetical protein